MFEIILSCCDERLNQVKIEWFNKKSLCIVLCSNGYPDRYEKNIEIKNLNKIKLKKEDFVFHAGTVKKNNGILAIGGRVLNFVSVSDQFNLAKKNVLNNLENLKWENGFYRKDIGYKVIE